MTVMRIALSEKKTLPFLAHAFAQAGGIAAMLSIDRLKQPFMFADESTAEPARRSFAFSAGLSQQACDEALFGFWRQVAAGAKKFLVYQNVWSKQGDLNASEEKVTDFFNYNGSYYHVCPDRGLIQDYPWRTLSIGYLKVVFIVRGDPFELGATNGADIDAVTAAAFCGSIETVFVSAFDDESWVGASVT